MPRPFLATVIALASAAGIFFLAGIPGFIITLYVCFLFELMHYRVYGKSIAQIEDADYHDHPDNPRNKLAALLFETKWKTRK